jgi:hypothetical protein
LASPALLHVIEKVISCASLFHVIGFAVIEKVISCTSLASPSLFHVIEKVIGCAVIIGYAVIGIVNLRLGIRGWKWFPNTRLDIELV